jgi:hypothetical protein
MQARLLIYDILMTVLGIGLTAIKRLEKSGNSPKLPGGALWPLRRQAAHRLRRAGGIDARAQPLGGHRRRSPPRATVEAPNPASARRRAATAAAWSR